MLVHPGASSGTVATGGEPPRRVAAPAVLRPAPVRAPRQTAAVERSSPEHLTPDTGGQSSIPVTTAPPGGAAVGTGAVEGAAAHVIISEVAPAAGWIELYNRGPTPAVVLGWSLTEGSSDVTVTVGEARPVPSHGFIVVEARGLHLGGPNSMLLLRRSDGTAVDTVPLGPAPAGRGWSRYPVHGGAWSANTPLTPGRINLPSEEPPAASAQDEHAPAQASDPEMSAAPQLASVVSPPVRPLDRLKVVLGMALLAIVGIGLRLVAKRGASP